MDRMKKYFFAFIKLLIALLILYFMIKATPEPSREMLPEGFPADASKWAKLAAVVARIHPVWLILASLLYLLHLYTNAWRWHLLLKAQKIDCSLFDAFSLTMQSFFFSLVIPGGAIGGDIVRAGFLSSRVPKEQKFDGVFTILMDRFTGMIGIFLTAVIMLPFCFRYLDTSSAWIRAIIVLIIAGCFCGLLGAVVIFCHRSLESWKLYLWGKRLADRMTGGLFSKLADALDSYAHCRKELFICIVSSIVFVNICLGCAGYSFARGIPPGWTEAGSVIESVTLGNIAGLLPITPSGVGARDFVILEVMKSSGMPAGNALVLALMMTCLIIFFSLLGGFFFLFNPGKKRKVPVE